MSCASTSHQANCFLCMDTVCLANTMQSHSAEPTSRRDGFKLLANYFGDQRSCLWFLPDPQINCAGRRPNIIRKGSSWPQRVRDHSTRATNSLSMHPFNLRGGGNGTPLHRDLRVIEPSHHNLQRHSYDKWCLIDSERQATWRISAIFKNGSVTIIDSLS